MGMNRFAKERILTTMRRLWDTIVEETLPIRDVGMAKDIVWYEDIQADTKLTPYVPETPWGGLDENYLFQFEAVIPPTMEGKHVLLSIETDREGWDATNTQFLAYVNGKLIQGLDVNHRFLTLTKAAKAGERYLCQIIGWTGTRPELAIFRAQLRAVNDLAWKVYYDIQTPCDCAVLMEEGSRLRDEILEYLNTACNLLDLRCPGTPAFQASLEAASRYMDETFYGAYCGQFNEAKVIALGHTHIDVAWLWTLFQTEQKTLRSFATANRLMEEYPEYIFMSSQPQLYKYLKKRDPALYETIRQRIQEGRWEAEGAMWLEADCNLASGEALVRQVIHGKRFFRQELGVESRILWLPDVFGYSAALPQILKKSGVDYFMTTKISWNESNKLPCDTFLWEGLDGTGVLTSFVTTSAYPHDSKGTITTYVGTMTAAQHMGVWDRYQHKGMQQTVLNLYGYGDGGGGTTPEMIERAKRFQKGIPGTPKLEFGTAGAYFAQLEKDVAGHKRLPKWVGELYLEFHRGTYTAQANNKKFNRRSEYACTQAEWLSVMARDLTGKGYDPQAIYDAWEEVLLLQFHDILPGSSIKEVYAQSDRQYAGILSAMGTMQQDGMRAIAQAAAGEGVTVTVFNPLSFLRDGPVEIELPAGWEYAKVWDTDGQTYPAQRTVSGRLLAWVEEIPSKGYATFRLEEAKAPETVLPAYQGEVTNGRYTLRLDQHGAIVSWIDRETGRELILPGEKARLMTYYEAPKNYDNWEISSYYDEQSWPVEDLVEARFVEDGPVRRVLRLTWRYLHSTISQDVITYTDSDQIDFATHMDWHESNVLVKALFPLDLHAVKASYDVQYGNVERATHANTSWEEAQFEVVAHKWADFSETGFGVALLNDCKYGHSIKDHQMSITLLKSTCYPDPDMDKKAHDFTYAVYPHDGGWREAGVHQAGCALNQPMMAVVSQEHGALAPSFSAVELDCANVMVEVIKDAYEGEGTILRLYEFEGIRGAVEVMLPYAPTRVFATSLLEEDGDEIPVQGQTFTWEMKPYEIATFRVIR